VLLFAALFAFSLSVSWAGLTEGSAQIARPSVDTASGQVYIYDGGFFNNNETVTQFTWSGSHLSGTTYLTPILFEETSTGVFVVRGVGTGQTITTAGAFTFAFGLTQGIGTTNTGNFVFGFINGLVNSAGGQTNSSTGNVDFSTPPTAGAGIDPSSTNDWMFTPT
jgi:hypothetical protein